MTLRRLAAVSIVLAFLFVRVAIATTLDPQDVTCPVCSNAFTALVVGSTNNFGGVDADGCAHAAGDQPMSVYVWTCPKCRYSNWGQDFLKGVKPETAAQIKKGLEPAVPVAIGAGQLAIPAWVKYDLASRVATMDGRAAADVAIIDLVGGWATRVESHDLAWPCADDPAVKPGWEAASKRFEALVADGPEKDPVGADRTRAETRAGVALLAETTAAQAKGDDASIWAFFAAWRLRVRGENDAARPVFVEIEAREKEPSALRAAALRIVDSIDRERAFQTRYVSRLDDVVRAAAANARLVAMRRYQSAEAMRRMGRAAEARAAYLALVADETPGWIFEAAVRALGDAAPTDRVDAVRRRHVDDAAKRVLDPKQAKDAAYELRQSMDPSAIPALVAALRSGEAEVREHAASAFEGVDEPGDAALDALAAVMLERGSESNSCARNAAAALQRQGATRTRESWMKAFAPGGSADVQEIAAQALGIVGEADTAEFLIGVRQTAARYVADALTCLTNREWKSAEAFEASSWWKENRGKARREWAISGFRDAGLAVPENLWQEANVPTLIAWLGDPRWWIRANAVRVLREITGNRFGWEALTQTWDAPRATAEREIAIRDWRRWWVRKDGKK